MSNSIKTLIQGGCQINLVHLNQSNVSVNISLLIDAYTLHYNFKIFNITQIGISSKQGNYQEDLPRFCFGDQSTYDETSYVPFNFSCSWKGNVMSMGTEKDTSQQIFLCPKIFLDILSLYSKHVINQTQIGNGTKPNHNPRKICACLSTDKVTLNVSILLSFFSYATCSQPNIIKIIDSMLLLNQ